MSLANNDRRQRIREQMKQFYGDPNAAGAGSAGRRAQDGSRLNPGVDPEMDLDSEYFNVMKYTTDLLRRESLKGLVESDTELLRSVRKLDGELQELVYRNYAKFISATDTIREMRENVAQMDAKLQTLSSNVASIDDVSKDISAKLLEHHGRIESTITTNRMLKKIQFLVELPSTMRRMLDKQAYSVCVKYWVAGDGFLAKHAAIPSIAKIQVECRALAKELYAKMERAMCAVSLDDPEAMDGIRSYVESLRLLRATSLFSEKEQRQDERSTTFEEGVLKVLMSSVSATFTSGVAAAQRGMKAALAAPPNLAAVELALRTEPLSQVSLREALAQLKSSCALLSVNSERVYTLLNKLDGSKVAMRVTEEVQPVLIDLLAPAVEQLSELAVAVLTSIADEGLIALHAPNVISSAIQSAVAALLKQLKHLAVTLKTLGANYLDTVLSRQSHSYAMLVDQAVCDVLKRVAEALVEKAWQQPDYTAVRAMAGSYANFAKSLNSNGSSNTTLSNAAADGTVANMISTTVNGATTTLVSGGATKMNAGEPAQRTAFAVTRWVYASMCACIAEECNGQLIQGDALSLDRASACMMQLQDAALQLLHRGLLLAGQLETAAVAPGTVGCAINMPDPTLPPAQGGGVPAVLKALVHGEWAQLSAVLDALPPILPRDPAAAGALFTKLGAASITAGGATRSPQYQQQSSSAMGMSMGNPPSYTGRMFTAGSTGRSSGPRSTGGGRGGSNPNGGRPTLSYTRREDIALQTSVDRIFSSGGGGAVLRTCPRDGRTATIMGCLVLYVCTGLVDHVRAACRVKGGYDAHAFQRVQVSGTYMLRTLLSPYKGTVQRQWIKAWDDGLQRDVQQQLNEACCCAYERYEAKVPLSNAALEKIVEEAMADPAAATAAAQQHLQQQMGNATAGAGGMDASAFLAAPQRASPAPSVASASEHSTSHAKPPQDPTTPMHASPSQPQSPQLQRESQPPPSPQAPVSTGPSTQPHRPPALQQRSMPATEAISPASAPKPQPPAPALAPVSAPTQAPAPRLAAPAVPPPPVTTAPIPAAAPTVVPYQQQPRTAPPPTAAAPQPAPPKAFAPSRSDAFHRMADDEELPM